MVITEYISIDSDGYTDVIDITSECQRLLGRAELAAGTMTIFNSGSTGGLTTIEYEPNLVDDLKDALEIIAPSDKSYAHGMTWNDDNGSSHIRSTFIGPSITVPFTDNTLTLGTWQQIIFCDFDTKPRRRRLVVQIIGE